MDVAKLLKTGSSQEIIDRILLLGVHKDNGSLLELCEFLTIKDQHTYDKHMIPVLVSRVILKFGKNGLKALYDTLQNIDGYIYPSAILSTVWSASKGKIGNDYALDIHKIPDEIKEFDCADLKDEAKLILYDIINDSKSDGELFSTLVNAIYQLKNMDGIYTKNDIQDSFFTFFTSGSIKLTKRTIIEYKQLIAKRVKEEDYQVFLETNPVFLDPLSAVVIPKQKLGIEYITDYVIKKYDGQYIAVEIERPYDPIFTQNSDFSHRFYHAFRQTLDFIDWIDSHNEYAQTILPGIKDPVGLVIIGLRTKLSVDQIRLLNKFNINSMRIKILTFDDLLNNANMLHSNLVDEIGND